MTSQIIRNKSPDNLTDLQLTLTPFTACDHKQRKENKMNAQRSLSTFSRIGIGALLMLTALIVTPHHAAANTASNTAIINTATVNYRDAGGTLQTPVSASATVTISLVPASPTLNAPADQNTTLAVAATYNYTITSNANGPDTYNLTIPSKVNSANITGSTALPAPTPISLGATTIFAPVTIAAGVPTAITVPSDGTSNGSVNGISAAVGNNTVVINGLVYTVNSIVDNASGTSTITVTGPASVALAYGVVIGEQKTFTLAVTPTTMNPTTLNETVTTTVSARDSGNVAVAATDVTVTTVPAANLTVVKEVSLNGTVWATAVAAPPGTLLYYRITVRNGGAGNATSVVITDPLSVYTTYSAGTAKRATGALVDYLVAPTTLTDLFGDADGFDFGNTPGVVTYTLPAAIAPGAANDVQLFFRALVK
jgi:uncharacterized repeat protein (TIGR01451 family)